MVLFAFLETAPTHTYLENWPSHHDGRQETASEGPLVSSRMNSNFIGYVTLGFDALKPQLEGRFTWSSKLGARCWVLSPRLISKASSTTSFLLTNNARRAATAAKCWGSNKLLFEKIKHQRSNKTKHKNEHWDRSAITINTKLFMGSFPALLSCCSNPTRMWLLSQALMCLRR
jgi:hypothetical protein